MTYLKTSFGAVLRNNADVWRVHTGTNKRVQVIVPQVSHLKTKEKNGFASKRTKLSLHALNSSRAYDTLKFPLTKFQSGYEVLYLSWGKKKTYSQFFYSSTLAITHILCTSALFGQN